jgi:hypothetical protein
VSSSIRSGWPWGHASEGPVCGGQGVLQDGGTTRFRHAADDGGEACGGDVLDGCTEHGEVFGELDRLGMNLRIGAVVTEGEVDSRLTERDHQIEPTQRELPAAPRFRTLDRDGQCRAGKRSVEDLQTRAISNREHDGGKGAEHSRASGHHGERTARLDRIVGQVLLCWCGAKQEGREGGIDLRYLGCWGLHGCGRLHVGGFGFDLLGGLARHGLVLPEGRPRAYLPGYPAPCVGGLRSRAP